MSKEGSRVLGRWRIEKGIGVEEEPAE